MSTITRNKVEEVKLTFNIDNCLDFSRLTAHEMKESYNVTFSIGESLGCDSKWKVFLERKNFLMVPVFKIVSSETTAIFDASGEIRSVFFSSNRQFGQCNFSFEMEADKEYYKPSSYCNLSLVGIAVPGEIQLTLSIKTLITDKQLDKNQSKKSQNKTGLLYNSSGQVEGVLDTQTEDAAVKLGSKPTAPDQLQNNNNSLSNATGPKYGNVTTNGEHELKIKSSYNVDQTTMQLQISSLQSFSELSQEQLLQMYGKEFELGESNDCSTLWKLVFVKDGKIISSVLQLLESKTEDVNDLKVEAAFVVTCGEGKVVWKNNKVLQHDGQCKLFNFPNVISTHDLASHGNSRATYTLRVQVGLKYDPTTEHSFTSRAQRTKKLKQDLEDLSDNFNNAEFCVIPCDGNSQYDTVYVHEAILSARCPALCQEMVDIGNNSNSEVPKSIRLAFLSKACLYIFVKYLYTSEIDENWKRYPLELIQAAHQYHLPELLQYFRRHIKEAETPSNATDITRVFDKIDTTINSDS